MAKHRDPDAFAAMRRFARPIQDASPQPDPFLCRHLRTKSWYIPDSHVDRDPSRSTATTHYWCLKTMRSDGPDGAPALAEDCTDERGCFEAAVLPAKGDS